MNTVTLEEVDGRTRWTLVIRCPSREVRDAIIDSGMEEGLQDALGSSRGAGGLPPLSVGVMAAGRAPGGRPFPRSRFRIADGKAPYLRSTVVAARRREAHDGREGLRLPARRVNTAARLRTWLAGSDEWDEFEATVVSEPMLEGSGPSSSGPTTTAASSG